MTEAVRAAIANGVHPKLIAKGSSGSYFARAKVEGRVQTVGYAPRLPLTLYLLNLSAQRLQAQGRRTVRQCEPQAYKVAASPILIHNPVWARLSYPQLEVQHRLLLQHACILTEAQLHQRGRSLSIGRAVRLIGQYLRDVLTRRRLGLYIVPRTELVSFSTPVCSSHTYLRPVLPGSAGILLPVANQTSCEERQALAGQDWQYAMLHAWVPRFVVVPTRCRSSECICL